jgi:hypothetical protein
MRVCQRDVVSAQQHDDLLAVWSGQRLALAVEQDGLRFHACGCVGRCCVLGHRQQQGLAVKA